MSTAIKAFCLLLLLAPLSHGAVAPILVENTPNCKVLEAKLKTNIKLYTKLQFYSRQSELRFSDWERTNFKSHFRKNSYLRSLKEMRDSSLLLYFNDGGKLQERSLWVRVIWPTKGFTGLTTANFMLPGFYPLTASQLGMVEGLNINVKDGFVELNYLMSPADYCLNQKIVISTGDLILSAQKE